MPIWASRATDDLVEAAALDVLDRDRQPGPVQAAPRARRASVPSRWADWAGASRATRPVGQVGRSGGAPVPRLDGRGGAVGDDGVDLERRPQATRPRQLDGVQAEDDGLAGSAGNSVGIARSASANSDEQGMLDDLAAGSSPTNATAPPLPSVPTMLACRSASVARSRPGALPYQ